LAEKYGSAISGGIPLILDELEIYAFIAETNSFCWMGWTRKTPWRRPLIGMLWVWRIMDTVREQQRNWN